MVRIPTNGTYFITRDSHFQILKNTTTKAIKTKIWNKIFIIVKYTLMLFVSLWTEARASVLTDYQNTTVTWAYHSMCHMTSGLCDIIWHHMTSLVRYVLMCHITVERTGWWGWWGAWLYILYWLPWTWTEHLKCRQHVYVHVCMHHQAAVYNTSSQTTR